MKPARETPRMGVWIGGRTRLLAVIGCGGLLDAAIWLGEAGDAGAAVVVVHLAVAAATMIGAGVAGEDDTGDRSLAIMSSGAILFAGPAGAVAGLGLVILGWRGRGGRAGAAAWLDDLSRYWSVGPSQRLVDDLRSGRAHGEDSMIPAPHDVVLRAQGGLQCGMRRLTRVVRQGAEADVLGVTVDPRQGSPSVEYAVRAMRAHRVGLARARLGEVTAELAHADRRRALAAAQFLLAECDHLTTDSGLRSKALDRIIERFGSVLGDGDHGREEAAIVFRVLMILGRTREAMTLVDRLDLPSDPDVRHVGPRWTDQRSSGSASGM